MASNQIRGLSLTRPWPFAFHHGKRVENRSWRPPGKLVGCYIALHAAKSFSEEDREFIAMVTGLDVPPKSDCPHSEIFAVARWNGVIILPEPETDEEGLIPTGQGLADNQSQWFFGPYGWLLEEYVQLPEPVKATGARGLWDIKPDVLVEVRKQFQIAMGVK